MTQTETRQLGIEFERRLQIMYPNAEFIEKLDTDTIYSMLNEYLIKYLKEMYLASQQLPIDSVAVAKFSDTIRPLLTSKVYTSDEVKILPEDYFMYANSESEIINKIKSETETSIVSNILLPEYNLSKLSDLIYNKGRIIRNPLIEIVGNGFVLYTDEYTTVSKLSLKYYKTPTEFNPTNKMCDLPISCFDELVSGAIQLYIMTYKFGLSLAANDRSDKSIKNGLRKLTKQDNEDKEGAES